MNRTLPPITEPVTSAELRRLFLREVYSAKDILNEDNIKMLLSSIGVDYDQARADAENMTDAELLALLST